MDEVYVYGKCEAAEVMSFCPHLANTRIKNNKVQYPLSQGRGYVYPD